MFGNLYLTGFMGSGKSTVGRELARRLGRTFWDLDERLEKRAGASIREIFATRGEAWFRELEAKLLAEAAGRKRLIVAAGGGVVENPKNIEVMDKSGRIVFLDAGFDACKQRIERAGADERPLWQDPAKVRALYDRRAPLYMKADWVVAADRPADEVAWDIRRRLCPHETFTVTMGGARSPVVAGLDGAKELARSAEGRKVFLLTDGHVDKLYADRYLAGLNNPVKMVLPPGEKTKTLKSAQKVYETLLERRFNRDDLLVALGGGVITDLGAYCAATYKRGMGFVLVSTTLLGCVDAAVGGKAAVNLKNGKNSIGVFTVPEKVILDAPAMQTLAPRHIREGMVEAYKTGLAARPELADFIARERRALLGGDLPFLFEAAVLSAKTKAEVVGDDYTEQGRRAILNLGHTYGHALEAWRNYRVSHGRAVAEGMKVAAVLSVRRGLLGKPTADEIFSVLGRISSGKAPKPPLDEAWEIMTMDKKVKAGRVRFVLLEGPGRPVIVDDVTPAELARAVAELE